MLDEFTLKFRIKETIETYNKNQKALYYNTFILKLFSILILIVFVSTILFFLIPFLTPFMLKTGVLSDILGLTFIGLLASAVLGLFIIYKFITRKKKKEQSIINNDNNFYESCLNETKNDNLIIENQIKKSPLKKKFLLLRIISLFQIIKDLISLVFSVLSSPVAKPNVIYFDNNKLEFTIWIINKLSKSNNYILEEDYVITNYKNYSNTWIKNTLKSLKDLEIIKLNNTDSAINTIFLNLDFHNPELD